MTSRAVVVPVESLIVSIVPVDAKRGTLVMLQAKSTQATNTITNPSNIMPFESTLQNLSPDLHYTAPAYSIQVIDLDQR